jgi:hypothetical protein
MVSSFATLVVLQLREGNVLDVIRSLAHGLQAWYTHSHQMGSSQHQYCPQRQVGIGVVHDGIAGVMLP